jgi:hypothetical protein
VKHRVTFAYNLVQNNTEINHKSTQDIWQMPMPINLDSSGLHCSSRTLVLNRCNEEYSHVTQMIQENMLPESLGLCLATLTLPVALDLSASFTLPAALDPSASSCCRPIGPTYVVGPWTLEYRKKKRRRFLITEKLIMRLNGLEKKYRGV